LRPAGICLWATMKGANQLVSSVIWEMSVNRGVTESLCKFAT
jgi:hypothetical protein